MKALSILILPSLFNMGQHLYGIAYTSVTEGNQEISTLLN